MYSMYVTGDIYFLTLNYVFNMVNMKACVYI